MRAAGRTNGPIAAFWLASLALLLRALLPGGVMLAPVSGGWGAAVVLCPGTAPKLTHATADQRGREDKPAPRGGELAPCGFAGLAAPHLPQSPAPAVALLLSYQGVPPEDGAVRVLAVRTAMPAPPPPSQAPPAAAA
ncbi:MAG: hypothetical protein ACOY45_02685 [Pseudomonadota bacterium]